MAVKTFTVLVVNSNGQVDNITTPAGRNAAEIIAALRPNQGSNTILVSNDGAITVDYTPNTAPSNTLKDAIMGEVKAWARTAPGYGTRSGDGGWDTHRATAVLAKDHRTDAQNKEDAIAFVQGWLDYVAGVGAPGGNNGGGNNGGSENGNGGNNGGSENGNSRNNGGSENGNGRNNGGSGNGNGGNNGGGRTATDQERSDYQAGKDLYNSLRR